MRRAMVAAIGMSALWLAGCHRRTAAPAETKSHTVEVISEAGAIARARADWAREREAYLARLLAEPAQIAGHDTESVEAIRQSRERSVKGLKILRDDPSKPAATRVAAACGLLHLGVRTEVERLVGLARADDEAAGFLLERVDEVWPPPTPLPQAFRDFLVRTIATGRDDLAGDAASLAAQRQVMEAGSPTGVRLRSRPGGGQLLLSAAAELHPTVDVLEVLLRGLSERDSLGGSSALPALAEFATHASDRALRRRALTACTRHLSLTPEAPYTDGASLTAIDTIAGLEPRGEVAAMLADLVRSGRHKMIRQSALQRLDELDRPLARRVSRESGITPKPDVRPTAPKVSLEQAANALVRHGILTRDDARAALSAVRAAYRKPRDPDAEAPGDSAALGLLAAAHRVTAFDVETDAVPNRHDRLVLEFARGSAARFRPEAVLERHATDTPDAASGRYTLQFVHGGRLYRTWPTDQGDWYDVPAVLAAIDRALADAGIGERFVAMESGGQTATVVFADPKALRVSAPALGLKLSSDSDAARREGKAFEKKAIEVLRKGR